MLGGVRRAYWGRQGPHVTPIVSSTRCVAVDREPREDPSLHDTLSTNGFFSAELPLSTLADLNCHHLA